MDENNRKMTKEAAMRPTYHDKPCFDHLGNIFGNIKSMCEFWHIRYAIYSRRVNVYKMSVEEALTRPVKPNAGLVVNGILFSIADGI